MASAELSVDRLVEAATQIEARGQRVTRESLAAQLTVSKSAVAERLAAARTDSRWKLHWCVSGRGPRNEESSAD